MFLNNPSTRTMFTQYPLHARNMVFTVLAYYSGLPGLFVGPGVGVSLLRDMAQYSVIQDQTLRTAISRAKGEGSLLATKDASGIIRYSMAESWFAFGSTATYHSQSAEGVTVAVVNEESATATSRNLVRDLLASAGFYKLSASTWIRGLVDSNALSQALEKAGMGDLVLFFACPVIDQSVQSRLLAIGDIPRKAEKLRHFLETLEKFLTAPVLIEFDEARRILYAGSFYFELCESGETLLPPSLLPPDYPLTRLRDFFGKWLAEHSGILASYFEARNNNKGALE